MPKAQRLASGNYRVRVYTHSTPKYDKNGKVVLNKDGKPVQVKHYESFTGSSRSDVEFEAAQFARNKSVRKKLVDMTLREAIDDYIATSDGVLSASTISGYSKIKKYYFPDLMDIKLRALTKDILRRAVNEESKRPVRNHRKDSNGNPRIISPKTIHNAYGLVTAVINQYRPGFDCTITLPALAPKIKELLPPDVIMEVVRGSRIELAALLAMWLSYTESEIRGLTKSKSIDGDYITIRETVLDIDGKPVAREKGKEYFRIRRHHIPPYIKRLIEQTDPAEDRLVPMTGKAMYCCFSRLLKKHGLPHMSFHDLRAVNASVMALLRIPDKYAQERGGWKTDTVMKKVYQTTFSAERVQVDNIMDQYFEEALKSKV